jgi:hypothetical protein
LNDREIRKFKVFFRRRRWRRLAGRRPPSNSRGPHVGAS